MLLSWNLLFIIFHEIIIVHSHEKNEKVIVAGPVDNPNREFEGDFDPRAIEDPFYEEWDEMMKGFHPKAFLNVPIFGRNVEKFYELIEKPATLIRGVFYTIEEEGEEFQISVVIKSPTGDVLYSKIAPEGIFSITANIPGEYVFELSNLNWLTEVSVSFVIGTDDHGLLSSEHIESTSTNLSRLKYSIDGIYTQYHYIWYRGQKQVKAAIREQKKLMVYAVIQLILIITCSLFGIWNIKKMVSNRRAV